MRRSEAALALIQPGRAGSSRWLARWNAKWHAYHFVGGHRDASEPFRAALIREITEEIGLHLEADYTLPPEPLARLAYNAWSTSAGAETAYVIELFVVRLRDGAERALATDQLVRWLTAAEVEQAQTGDGRPISPTMLQTLNRAGLDPAADLPWESQA